MNRFLKNSILTKFIIMRNLFTKLSLFVLLLGAQVAFGQVTEVNPTDDAFVRGGANGDTPYNNTILDAKNAADINYTRNTFLKFDLSNLKQGDGKYILKLTPTSDKSIGCNFWVVNDDNWSEITLTWNTMPTEGALIGESQSTGGAVMEIDVTNQVKAEMAGDQVLSVKIFGTDALAPVNTIFHSKEADVAEKHPVIQYEGVTSVGQPLLYNVNIYPNPANDILFVENASEQTVVSIYGLTGQLMKQVNYQGQMDIADLAKGFYIVVVEEKGQKKSFKLEKQ